MTGLPPSGSAEHGVILNAIGLTSADGEMRQVPLQVKPGMVRRWAEISRKDEAVEVVIYVQAEASLDSIKIEVSLDNPEVGP